MPHWLVKLSLAGLIFSVVGQVVLRLVSLAVGPPASANLFTIAFPAFLVCALWPVYRQGEQRLNRD